MKISTKSADDVRANLKRLERERSSDKLNSSAGVARVNNELMKVKEQCAQLKQELVQVQSSVKSQKEEWAKGVDCLREQPVNGKSDTGIERFESTKTGRSYDDEIAHYGTKFENLKDTLHMSNGESATKSKRILSLEESCSPEKKRNTKERFRKEENKRKRTFKK